MSGRSRNQKGRGNRRQGNPAQQQTQQAAPSPPARQPQRNPSELQAIAPQDLDGSPEETRGRTAPSSQPRSRSGSQGRAPSAGGGNKKAKVPIGYDPDTGRAYDMVKNVDLGGNAYRLRSGVSIHFFLPLIQWVSDACVRACVQVTTSIILLRFNIFDFLVVPWPMNKSCYCSL